MVDVTARFHALAEGKIHRVPHDQVLDPFYKRADEIAAVLLRDESLADVYDLQEPIEQLGEEVIGSDAESLHKKAIVSILFDRLRSRLETIQSRQVQSLERSLNMQRHFQPKKMFFQPKQAAVPLPTIDIPESALPSLQHEEETLLATYLSDQDQTVEVRRKLQETSALLSLLSQRVSEQHEVALGVLEVAEQSVGYVEQADAHLAKAIAHNSGYKFYVVCWFLVLGFALLLLDGLR